MALASLSSGGVIAALGGEYAASMPWIRILLCSASWTCDSWPAPQYERGPPGRAEVICLARDRKLHTSRAWIRSQLQATRAEHLTLQPKYTRPAPQEPQSPSNQDTLVRPLGQTCSSCEMSLRRPRETSRCGVAVDDMGRVCHRLNPRTLEAPDPRT